MKKIRTIVKIDKTIHEPARLAIMAKLITGQVMDATLLKAQVGLSWGNLSIHLGKLEQAGYVKVIKTYRGRKPRTQARVTAAGKRIYNQYKKEVLSLLR